MSIEHANKYEYTLEHAVDLRMSGTKEKSKALKKIRKSKISNTNEDSVEKKQITTSRQRVYLYLQPKSITYSLDDIPSGKVEIEVEHCNNTITTLSDHFISRNIIYVDQFNIVKPTFSITIDQDSVEHISILSDSPVVLTLYVHTQRKSNSNTTYEEEKTNDENNFISEERIPVAQGHIDIMEYFNKKRSRSMETIYLYPLKTFNKILTCKTEWEIYSLHPLLKNLMFSNFLFITLGSLYNLNEELINDGENLAANLSFISKVSMENDKMDKYFICKFKNFHKDIICNQNPSNVWESLKNKEYENFSCMGISSESKFTLSDLFSNILNTENVELNFNRINIKEDFALICNSMHRFVLTDTMQKTLEEQLATNQYQILIEIYSESDENKILLQGYMDLSIFMYPGVKYCSYGVELKQPDSKSNHHQVLNKDTLRSGKMKRKSKNTLNPEEEQSTKEDKIPFGIVNICVCVPITNPPYDILEMSNLKSKLKYDQCTPSLLDQIPTTNLESLCEKNYRAFNDLIREILDYIIRNKIESMSDDKEYFCNQQSNITNKIMKLVACDFNIRKPTKTNIEFTNLLTTVYQDLVSRIYAYINKCNINYMEISIFGTSTTQNFIITNMSLAKYMYEVGNLEIANYFIDKLRSEHNNNNTIDFYIFLFDIEKKQFELVKKYLDLPLKHKYIEGELFMDLVQIYMKYKLQLHHPVESQTAEEDLIKALTDYNKCHHSQSLTGWILLYCVYKKYNYQPGMSYCRWKYENLYDDPFVKLEFIPKSRWQIYMPHKIVLKSVKGQNYIKVFDNLLNLGLYDFAEWIFDEIDHECLEVENYCVSSTFKILNKNDEIKISTKTFPVDKLENPLHLRATLSQINGNLEYFQDPFGPSSFKHYQEIVELKDLEEFSMYKLGLLRYAYRMMNEEQYEAAGKAFCFCCNGKINCMASAIGKGKACYYLGQLDEAEKYFALSTKYGLYMPNTWSYLALINLKKGNNYNALECWKYSRLNQNTEIHEEIINELNKISINDISLYVDIPNKI